MKMEGRLMMLTMLPLILSASLARAQSGPVDLRESPLAALRAFEPPAGEEYQLGRGDEIALDFSTHSELSGRRVIGPDGRITLPLAGSIKISDKTREEAAQSIVAALEPFYSNIEVTVGVEKYTSNRVLLLGAVEHPGIINFDAPPTLLEVVTRGGVLGGGESQTKRPAIPERCVIYRGDEKVMWVDLKGLLDSGSSLADLRLRRDDVIYVPSSSDRFVSVLGQVQHPGAFLLDSTSTLVKLLAQAGGLTDAAGANADVRVISPATGVTRVIPMKMLMQAAPLDLSLKPGDIIFIAKSRFNNVSYVFEKLSPLISIFTAFAFLEN